MSTVKIYPERILGAFKPLNAVNNGPCCRRHANDQLRSNFDAYKAARIPFARNHDASFETVYGGEHGIDISAVFPDFTKSPYEPDSYDFACTDEAILTALDADTKVFYRLGQKIEHYIKKYNIYPPADFHKWAVVCEHIIRHYTKGWANGFFHDMPYWEIWNEPDLDPDEATNKRTWGGTKAQFFDLFEITAKHLKRCFPELKIGGPALACNTQWATDFLAEMSRRNVPLDFFSWHIYCTEPSKMVRAAEIYRNLLDENGYTSAESILNEWNYVKGWEDEFVYSIKQIIGVKGASFIMGCISSAQRSSIDMLMYYDARPCTFCGMWDFYTLEPLKGYYPFFWYGDFYDMKDVECTSDDNEIFVLAGVGENGKATAIVTYYTDDDNAADKEICVNFGREGEYDLYLVDKDHNGEKISTVKNAVLTMKNYSFVKICEK